MDMCKNDNACCEVALQPLSRYDLDAAIVFSDILTIPEAMGMKLDFITNKGPVFESTIKTVNDVDKLDDIYTQDKLEYVFNAVSTTKKALKNKIPLIGFSGSPWTLAAYMIEGQGSKQFTQLRKMMYSQPLLLHKLLLKITSVIKSYLTEQINSGADSIMIFDTWGGLLSSETYRPFSLDYMTLITKYLKKSHPNIPVTLFTKGGGLWLDKISQSGCDAAGIDWTISASKAKNVIKNKISLQGNMDPAALYGSDVSIRETIKNIMQTQENNHQYIFNLGHGVYPDIDPNKVKVMVDAVREFGIKKY